MKIRLIVSLLTGALLGVFCILGANLRFGGTLGNVYLFAFWFNRLLMGLVIGLITFEVNLPKRLLRGFILGLIISFAFYSATNFKDLVGFLVGGVYGIIIEYAALKIKLKKQI